jgi:GT2 family glycosyltransferase
LVDHGTTDETGAGIRREFPEVVQITGGTDLWWAGATNLGIKAALEGNPKHIMLLNNDCYVSHEAVELLLKAAKKVPNAIIAPVQRDAATGDYISITPGENLLFGFTTLHGPKHLTDSMRAKGLLPTRLIVGGRGSIIPSNIFRRIGMLDDESLPHYGADHDFYLRCRNAGIPLLVAANAEVAVDNRRTSLSRNVEALDWSEFRETLRSRKSHRNLKDVRALLKKHYPLKNFYLIGVGLCFIRYVGAYLFMRLRSVRNRSS